jgi:hypothetical protein
LLSPAAVGEIVDLVYLGQGADQQAAMDETSGRADVSRKFAAAQGAGRDRFDQIKHV